MPPRKLPLWVTLPVTFSLGLLFGYFSQDGPKDRIETALTDVARPMMKYKTEPSFKKFELLNYSGNPFIAAVSYRAPNGTCVIFNVNSRPMNDNQENASDMKHNGLIMQVCPDL